MEFVRPSGEANLRVILVHVCSVRQRTWSRRQKVLYPDWLHVEDVHVVATVLCVHFSPHYYIYIYVYIHIYAYYICMYMYFDNAK